MASAERQASAVVTAIADVTASAEKSASDVRTAGGEVSSCAEGTE